MQIEEQEEEAALRWPRDGPPKEVSLVIGLMSATVSVDAVAAAIRGRSGCTERRATTASSLLGGARSRVNDSARH